MLRNDIEVDALMIARLLSDSGTLTVRQIGEITGYREKMIILALGWLARENKIEFFEREETIYIKLKNYSEMYY